MSAIWKASQQIFIWKTQKVLDNYKIISFSIAVARFHGLLHEWPVQLIRSVQLVLLPVRPVCTVRPVSLARLVHTAPPGRSVC